jgi:hypothetical protein
MAAEVLAKMRQPRGLPPGADELQEVQDRVVGSPVLAASRSAPLDDTPREDDIPGRTLREKSESRQSSRLPVS